MNKWSGKYFQVIQINLFYILKYTDTHNYNVVLYEVCNWEGKVLYSLVYVRRKKINMYLLNYGY